ncbi:MAG: hypothetical protein ACI30H_00200 [Paludibacteraceae bacterium]
MSKFIEKRVDKFSNKTELVTQEVFLCNGIHASFRYWSVPEAEAFLLDVHYAGSEWMYLSGGYIVIRINDAKNINIKPSGEDSDVDSYDGNVTCSEDVYYEVKKEDFIDICKATSIEIKLSGSRSFVTVSAEKLQAMARVLYDNLYEPIFDATKALEEQASKRNTILSWLFALPASIAGGFFAGELLWDLWHRPFNVFIADGRWWEGIPPILFCVVNYFLPYSRKMKWITYALFVIIFICIACIE